MRYVNIYQKQKASIRRKSHLSVIFLIKRQKKKKGEANKEKQDTKEEAKGEKKFSKRERATNSACILYDQMLGGIPFESVVSLVKSVTHKQAYVTT